MLKNVVENHHYAHVDEPRHLKEEEEELPTTKYFTHFFVNYFKAQFNLPVKCRYEAPMRTEFSAYLQDYLTNY